MFILIIFIIMFITVGIFLLLLKCINKWIFKNRRKIDLKEIFIGWIIIFIINSFAVITDVPFVIGIPFAPFNDAGEHTLYISLGYWVSIKSQVFYLDGDDVAPSEVSFFNGAFE